MGCGQERGGVKREGWGQERGVGSREKDGVMKTSTPYLL